MSLHISLISFWHIVGWSASAGTCHAGKKYAKNKSLSATSIPQKKNVKRKATKAGPAKVKPYKKSAKQPAVAAGRKRKRMSNPEATNSTTKEKRQKTRSLMMADIPEIVTTVVNALPTSDIGSAGTTSSRRMTRSAEKQTTQHQDSSDPWEFLSSESEDDADSEEFGKH